MRYPTFSFQIFVMCLVFLAGPVRAQPQPGPCVERVLPSGAKILVCVPESGWNGDLVLFAHGYTAFNEPLDFQNLSFGEVYLPELVQRLGFAFATSSYRETGMAVLSGVEDMRQLALVFPWVAGRIPNRIFLAGASEGGLVTALAIERYPNLFAGGLSLCGPIGDFNRQLDTIGDFRVLFDVYYPGLLPGSALDVPDVLIDQWSTVYRPLIETTVLNDLDRAIEVLRVGGVAHDPGDPATVVNSVEGMLWYHTFGTLDARVKLGGNPFDNARRRYRGSSDDAALNAAVERVREDPITRFTVRPYETSGRLTRPLVTLHTTGDEIIPFWHQRVYLGKARRAGSQVWIFPIDRYGHCEFEVNELIGGFAWLLLLTPR